MGQFSVTIYRATGSVLSDNQHARLLKPYGVDLWSAHPAPDFLSLMVCVALFLMAVATNLTLMDAPALAVRKSCWQALFLFTMWLSLALILY